MGEKDLTEQMASFGDYIAARRKALNLKQKDLAAKIRKGDGTHISIPYLHDVEAGKRNPLSDDMIEQLGTILDVQVDVLYFYAERLPADLKKFDVAEEQILASYVKRTDRHLTTLDLVVRGPDASYDSRLISSSRNASSSFWRARSAFSAPSRKRSRQALVSIP